MLRNRFLRGVLHGQRLVGAFVDLDDVCERKSTLFRFCRKAPNHVVDPTKIFGLELENRING